MILIGLGSNLLSADGHSPVQNLENALACMKKCHIQVLRTSRFYETAPVPADGAPWYVNAVAEVSFHFSAQDLLKSLLAVEKDLGRVRGKPNAPRIIDLDLLDFQGQVIKETNLILPHPRIAERAFVLKPLSDIAPAWRHPLSGKSLTTLVNEIETDRAVRPLTT